MLPKLALNSWAVGSFSASLVAETTSARGSFAFVFLSFFFLQCWKLNPEASTC
jgi:hypothetical protein